MDEVEVLCDRIGILRDGKLISIGKTADAIAESSCDTLENAYLFFTGEEANYE